MAACDASGTPSGKPSGKAPLVLFVHGGGWSAGARTTRAAAGRRSISPRKAMPMLRSITGWCREYGLKSRRGDVARALKFLLGRADELGIDPARVVLMGQAPARGWSRWSALTSAISRRWAELRGCRRGDPQ
ncbi:hypothetical protein [Novosphingobium sp.]|uniref:alpha/beta hydrolase n=1 Tax=Novosphingobium sp. TaxID=1874826 RepID=UPI00343C3BB2